MEVRSHRLYCIPFVTGSSLCSRGAITEGCECQEARILGSHLKSLPTIPMYNKHIKIFKLVIFTPLYNNFMTKEKLDDFI